MSILRVGDGTHSIGLVSLNSNSETHMTVICNARLIYGRGRISWVFICCVTLKIHIREIVIRVAPVSLY